jgi:MFS transporter, DHA3 family, macrolide efflux protein
MGMAPIGLAIAGPLADWFGVQLWFVLGALICGLMAIWIILSPTLLNLEAGTVPSTTPMESAVK